LPGAEGRVRRAPDLAAVRPEADVCFTWNGTTRAQGADADWIGGPEA
jgi:hypothetical protein